MSMAYPESGALSVDMPDVSLDASVTTLFTKSSCAINWRRLISCGMVMTLLN